jgi:hypothetical protein
MQEGYQALKRQLGLYKSGKSRHTDGSESLLDVMRIYAPSSDYNDPDRYAQDIADIIGVTPDTPIKDINTDAWALAISQLEDPAAYKQLLGEGIYPATPQEKNIWQEAMGTLRDEGVGALAAQAVNKASNVYHEKTGGKEDIVVEDTAPMTPTEWKQALGMPATDPLKAQGDLDQEWLHPTMPETTLLSKGIPNTSKGVIHQPIAVNTTKVKFGYRNREQEGDIKTKGALISTYNPFRSTKDYLGKHYAEGKGGFEEANSVNDSVIALNTKTGEVMGGTFKDFKDNPDVVVSRTLPAKKVTSISISGNNRYFDKISQRGIRLHTNNGKYTDVPIGIGTDNSGKRLTGWSGGKMFITKPDGSEGYFVYGTAQQLARQLEEYKNTHQVDYVLWYDMDHKAFSQAMMPQDGVLKSDMLNSIQHDDTNSTGGHFLYLK